ncbi:hypothetical protein QBC38DRAFT_356863 [Podospora fimiseda]|uniref:Uncharacterized protein n=1 Tax=Podospora fimiseda TaxID=252190 RepID=A0AAN7BVU6_9PEZI|nr:hypothetical protein QBC38DRAFT_356863 [Podospora fimiseda]
MDQASSPGQGSSQHGVENHHEPGIHPRLDSDGSSEYNGRLSGENLAKEPGGPLERKDTASSTATVATTIATQGSGETVTTAYSLQVSPETLAASQQHSFAISNGNGTPPGNNDTQRRSSTSRRRTGPLSAEQRKRASYIRKIGACSTCKKRRVACDPSHKATTWDAASEAIHEVGLAPDSSRSLSSVLPASRPPYSQDQAAMDIDLPPLQQSAFGTPPAPGRTPLPSSPRLHRPFNLVPVAGQDSFRAELQGTASRIASNPLRSRYARVSVLLARWQDDEDETAKKAMEDLADTLSKDYDYKVEPAPIPTYSGGKNNSALWLTNKVAEFLLEDNQRDVLKIFCYSGHSYLGPDRDTIFASSKKPDPESFIPWQGIQQLFENTYTDSLVILDCAYYPMYQNVRQKGMLEVIAASAGWDHLERLRRGTFTHIVNEQLKSRAAQKFKEPFTAASLHAKLVSEYATLIQGHNQDQGITINFPTPILLQESSNKVLPSIPLTPLRKGTPPVFTPDSPTSGYTLRFTFNLSENTYDLDAWSEWLRSMPVGIKEVKVEGPYRDTFR